MKPLAEIAAEVMARRGLDENTPVIEPPPFDPVAYRIEQAELALGAVVPNRFRGASVDNAQVAGWVRRFLSGQSGCPSLLLAGEVATGKTYLAFAALRAVALHAAEHRMRVEYRVTTHPDFNQLLRPKSDGSHEFALEPFAAADLLVFDDLGAGKQTDWTADSLHRLVDHRWSDDLPTIYTTNLDPEPLAAAVGQRVVSRVFDSTRVLLTGPDRRRQSNGGQR
jgi:DNA replication protein DnaC